MPETPPDPTFRYDAELAPGYFVQAATVFLRAPNVTPLAKVLYLVLCSHAGAGEVTYPGQALLAGECATSVSTLHRAQQELVNLGLLEVERRGLTLTNRYYLHKLPVKGPSPESSNSRFKKRQNRGPRITPLPHKVESPESESRGGNPQQINAPSIDEVQARYLAGGYRAVGPE